MFITIFVFFFLACEKIPKPYVKKWLGTYECEEVYNYWIGTGDNALHGTEVYQTNIVVTAKGDLVDFFDNRKEKNSEARVNKDGSFYETNETGSKLTIKGNFHADSLNLTIYHASSPGSSITSYYKGKKIKSK